MSESEGESQREERQKKKRKRRNAPEKIAGRSLFPFTLPQPLHLSKQKQAIMQLSAARSVRPARSSTLKCSAIKAQTPYADELIATAVSEPLLGEECSPFVLKGELKTAKKNACTKQGAAVRRRLAFLLFSFVWPRIRASSLVRGLFSLVLWLRFDLSCELGRLKIPNGARTRCRGARFDREFFLSL